MAVLGTSMEEREKRTAKETVGTRTGARKQRERQRNRQADDEIVHGLAANLLQRREMSTL